MKRDTELIRHILEYVECNSESKFLAAPSIEGYKSSEVQYHIKLCKEAGLVNVDGGNLRSLTWQGHNMLDTLRGTSSPFGTV